MSFLSERTDRAAAPLAVGDVLAILVVIGIGMTKHHGVDGVLGDPVGVLVAALPFLVGWAVVAVPIGAYSAGAAESAKSAVPLAIRSWVGGALVGILVRGLLETVRGVGGFDLNLAIFFVVMLFTGSLALGVWRWVFFKVQ